jgi:hypothetical protein
MVKEAIIRTPGLIFLAVIVFYVCSTSSAIAFDFWSLQDYSYLLELIRGEDQDEPLYVFDEYEEFDRTVHEQFLRYINRNPETLRKIQSELGSKSLKWRIEQFKKRRMFVPENREDYIFLYESYCQDIVDFIIDEIPFENPYAAIKTLQQAKPEIHPNEGITVFLVHKLIEQWTGTYSFFNETNNHEMSITLKSTTFSGEIGSYSSMLEISDENKVEFTPDQYTIWQNSSAVPYNVLIVPLEETFHILLRPYTEKAIHAALNKSQGKTKEEIVANWVSVEEAMVGGLVDVFFRRIACNLFPDYDLSDIEPVIEEKSRTTPYKYLKNGIRTIEKLGVESTLNLYTSDPKKYRDRLVSCDESSCPS